MFQQPWRCHITISSFKHTSNLPFRARNAKGQQASRGNKWSGWVALIGLIGLKIQRRSAETHGQLLTMSWEADCESGLHRFNQLHAVLLSTHHSPNCLICFPYQPGSCCFCIHLAETGELLSGTCWTPALPLVPNTLRLRWCWPGLHNASGLLHSMALNDVVKLVYHTHHTNIILMAPLCCRLVCSCFSLQRCEMRMKTTSWCVMNWILPMRK